MKRIMILKHGDTIREIRRFPFDIEKGDTFTVAKKLYEIRAPNSATVNGYSDSGLIASPKDECE